MCYDDKLANDCEVYGLFADLLSAVAEARGGELEWGRARQGSDYRVRLPTPEGVSDCLAELKFVSAGVTWYPRGVQGRGTDRRAGLTQSEYKRKLAKYNHRYHGIGPGQSGPLVRRLEGYWKLCGLVVDLHNLISIVSNSLVAAKARARGWEGGEGELVQAISQIRG